MTCWFGLSNVVANFCQFSKQSTWNKCQNFRQYLLLNIEELAPLMDFLVPRALCWWTGLATIDRLLTVPLFLEKLQTIGTSKNRTSKIYTGNWFTQNYTLPEYPMNITTIISTILAANFENRSRCLISWFYSYGATNNQAVMAVCYSSTSLRGVQYYAWHLKTAVV